MKRIMITLFVFLTLAATSAFAGEVNVSPVIRQAFNARFTGAENVSWSQADEFTVAEFTLDEVKQYAYFNSAGELTVVAQPMTVKQLSKRQQETLNKGYGDYTIVNVYKTDDGQEQKYYAVVENDNQKVIVSTTSSRWEVVKSTKK
jgi:hypothetical protein